MAPVPQDVGVWREEYMATYVPNTIANLKPGDHVCWFFETQEEHHAVITPFMRRGLEQEEKVLYIAHEHTPESILGHLLDDGFDPEPYLASGQLCFFTPDETYVQSGAFDPDRMLARLHNEMDRAIAEGYIALRATGEMSWAQKGVAGAYRLPEYEAKLNEFLLGNRCLLMCQYHQRCFANEETLKQLSGSRNASAKSSELSSITRSRDPTQTTLLP